MRSAYERCGSVDGTFTLYTEKIVSKISWRANRNVSFCIENSHIRRTSEEEKECAIIELYILKITTVVELSNEPTNDVSYDLLCECVIYVVAFNWVYELRTAKQSASQSVRRKMEIEAEKKYANQFVASNWIHKNASKNFFN